MHQVTRCCGPFYKSINCAVNLVLGYLILAWSTLFVSEDLVPFCYFFPVHFFRNWMRHWWIVFSNSRKHLFSMCGGPVCACHRVVVAKIAHSIYQVLLGCMWRCGRDTENEGFCLVVPLFDTKPISLIKIWHHLARIPHFHNSLVQLHGLVLTIFDRAYVRMIEWNENCWVAWEDVGEILSRFLDTTDTTR